MNAAAGAAQRDPGLQGERTALAWIRTALAMSVSALLILRCGLVTEELPITAAGVALLVAALACALCGAWRRRSLLGVRAAGAPPASMIFGVAVVTLAASVAAVVSVVVSSRHAQRQGQALHGIRPAPLAQALDTHSSKAPAGRSTLASPAHEG